MVSTKQELPSVRDRRRWNGAVWADSEVAAVASPYPRKRLLRASSSMTAQTAAYRQLTPSANETR
jgi:hypothetical protein